MLSLDRTTAIAVKEFKQLVRDRITFAMIVMIPLVQLLLFGYAINTDVRQVPAGYVDDSGSSVGAVTASSSEPRRTFSPACVKMRIRVATLAR